MEEKVVETSNTSGVRHQTARRGGRIRAASETR